MIAFDRSICNQLSEAESREWLVTNGLGGYAAGTISGIATRRYHGLLIAALNPPVERTLLVAELDEMIEYADKIFELSASRLIDDSIVPEGYRYIEKFWLEGTTPCWCYAFEDALLEKRIWMQPGENTTYVRYDFIQGSEPIYLVLDAMVNHRDHHSRTRAGEFEVEIEVIDHGLHIHFKDQPPFYIFCEDAQIFPQFEWLPDYYYSLEAYRGLPAEDAHLFAGVFTLCLDPGSSLTVILSTQRNPTPPEPHQIYENKLLVQSGLTSAPDWIQQLVLAADQFIVQRATPPDSDGRSIIAGYPWFSDWGRDTMIALPGLTLATRRYEIAEKILRTFASHVSQGMLPNRFPDEGGQAEYNTVDATLWYFEALRAYHAATGDDNLLRYLYPTLCNIIEWHQKGTRFHIHMDPADGLLYAGESGAQLTWMDVKIGDWVVTPRTGKPVEINALWYNALCILADFAERLAESGDEYRTLARRVAQSFSRFWNGTTKCCFDVIAGPQGDDPALRPNQLIAVSLPNSPLSPVQQCAIVDACQRELLFSWGLLSLSPQHLDFIGTYGGDQTTRDAAYHQGTGWSWLIGPFVSAHLKVYRDPEKALAFLLPFEQHLSQHGLGTISEIFDGNPPHTPRGCFAQAWGVAEVLRAWDQIRNFKESPKNLENQKT
ncbi:MAG TPA: glycogen debranching protein [Chloroflexi bacterium]|nr:glycogen debranching protein [Chloroflexota bacterium]